MASPLVAALLLPLLKVFLGMVTPVLRTELEEWVTGWYKRCKESSNKADDVAAALVAALLQVDVSKVMYTPNPAGNIPPDVVNDLVSTVITVSTGKDPMSLPGMQGQ